MFLAEKRHIAITNDLDGVHVDAPVPFITLRRLVLRNYRLPEESFEVIPYASPSGVVGRSIEAITALTHRNRTINLEGIPGLQMLRETARDFHRHATFMALSGRVKPTHEVTYRELGPTYNEFFTRWLLNEGNHSAEWKEYQARELTKEGFSVVHLEDDLNPALRMARVENVLVYLFSNLSNHPKLLNWAGIELPTNVISVNNFETVNEDFRKRLLLGLV